jgi:nitrogen fixation protein FixH
MCCGAFIMPVELQRPSGAPDIREGGFTLTGYHVLAGLLAFFVIVASVNAYMMTMALTTMPGLDARNGYDVSQTWNAQIAAARSQEARHWQVEASLKRTSGAQAELVISLTDADGRPLTGLDIAARLAHPATRRLDRAAVLTEVSPGRYLALVDGLTRGAWDLVTDAKRDGETVYVSRNRTRLDA